MKADALIELRTLTDQRIRFDHEYPNELCRWSGDYQLSSAKRRPI